MILVEKNLKTARKISQEISETSESSKESSGNQPSENPNRGKRPSGFPDIPMPPLVLVFSLKVFSLLVLYVNYLYLPIIVCGSYLFRLSAVLAAIAVFAALFLLANKSREISWKEFYTEYLEKGIVSDLFVQHSYNLVVHLDI